jgi:hypothetical protein
LGGNNCGAEDARKGHAHESPDISPKNVTKIPFSDVL